MITVSISQLELYLSCPKKYFYRYVEKLPTRPSRYASFGISIHGALHSFYSHLISDHQQPDLFGQEKRIPTKEQLLISLDTSWIALGYPDKETEYREKQRAQTLLIQWYHKYHPHFGYPVSLEKSFRYPLGDITIIGRWDRVDRDPDGSYHVIDYKSGAIKTRAEVAESLQLTLYTIGVEHAFRGRVAKASMYFITEDSLISIPRDELGTQNIIERIQKAAQGIKEKQFQSLPEVSKCASCDFNKICPDALLSKS